MVAYRVDYVNGLGDAGIIYFKHWQAANAWMVVFEKNGPCTITAIVIHLDE